MSKRPDASKPLRPSQPLQGLAQKSPAADPPTRINSPSLPGGRRAAVYQRMYVQRTLIPILLTMGLLFCALGAAQWEADPEYPFAAKNLLWCAVALPVAGGVFLLLAVVNMVAVAKALRDAG